MSLAQIYQRNKSWIPWIIAVVAIGILLWYIFAPSSKVDPSNTEAYKQLERINADLRKTIIIDSMWILDSERREDSLQDIITKNQVAIQNAVREKNRVIDFYRDALNRRDIPAMQKFFTDRYSKKK